MFRVLPVTTIFIIMGILIIRHAIKTRGKKRKSVLIDELLLGVFHFILGFLYYVYFIRFPPLSDTLFLLTNIFSVTIVLILITLILAEVVNVKIRPRLKEKRGYENFRRQFLANFKKENRYKRRITHIIPVFVVLPIYLIGKSLAPVFPQWEGWSVGLIVIVGTAFILFFSIGDLVRVSKPYLLPDWATNLFSKGLNEEEVKNNTFTTTSAMVLSISPWILAGLFIFTIVTLVTSVSDAMAAVVGFKFGKRKFPKHSKKTVAGYVGGILTTFGLAVATFIILSTINPLYIIIVSSWLALTFFLIDFLNLPIDDNKINPHVIGLVLLILLASV